MIDTVILGIAACVGAIMGLFFVLSGFKDNQKHEDLQKNPRVKNLLWVLGGAFTAMLTDWKILSNDDLSAPQRGLIVASYLVACVFAIIATLFLMSFAIYFGNRFSKTRPSSVRAAGSELLLVFWHYGYPKYIDRLAELEKSAPTDLMNTRENMAQLGEAISTSIVTAIRDAAPGISKTHRQSSIKSIMDNIESTVVLMAGSSDDLQIKTNYMAVISVERHTREGGCQPKFKFGKEERYKHYLMLRRYKGAVGEEMCLPVEPKGSSSQKLPGAPTAFSTESPVIVNCNDKKIGKHLPSNISKDVLAYFRTVEFASFMSLPIYKSQEVVGIVNIESNQLDIVGQGPTMALRVARAVQPYCILLGEVVSALEGETQI